MGSGGWAAACGVRGIDATCHAGRSLTHERIGWN